MYNVPNDWKLGNYMELSPDEKLKWLYNATQELEEEISQLGGSDVSVTAEYTQQTYNNKLATITVDETATDIYAPKVDVTNLLDDGGSLIANVKIGSTTKAIRMPSTVVQGSQIVMPARVLLGFQTALVQINSTTMKKVGAYTSTNNEDDIALADEMIGEIENGNEIYPVFDMASNDSVFKTYPLMSATVYDQDSNPKSYDFWYKTPIYTGSDGAYVLYDVYVELLVWSAGNGYQYSGYQIYLYGTLNAFTP